MRQVLLISYILSLCSMAYGFDNYNYDCHNLTRLNISINLNDYSCGIEEIGVLLQTASFWLGLPENNSSMPILKIPKGTKVKILNLEKEYYRINHKDLIGYIEKKLVKLVEMEPYEKELQMEKKVFVQNAPPKSYSTPTPINTSSFNGYTVSKATSLRKDADHKSRVLLRLPIGGAVEILESPKGHWWKVKYEGTIGWAKCALLKKGN